MIARIDALAESQLNRSQNPITDSETRELIADMARWGQAEISEISAGYFQS